MFLSELKGRLGNRVEQKILDLNVEGQAWVAGRYGTPAGVAFGEFRQTHLTSIKSETQNYEVWFLELRSVASLHLFGYHFVNSRKLGRSVRCQEHLQRGI